MNLQTSIWFCLSCCFLINISVLPRFPLIDLSNSALEFLSTCKIANLTIRAELGCCLLHRSGKLTIQECLLQCEQNPLDYLSFPIISTAIEYNSFPSLKEQGHGVTVVRTRIEGGAKAVRTNGTLALQRVRAIYSRSSVFFWFEVGEK